VDYGLAAFGTALGDPVPVAAVLDEYTGDVERVLGYGYQVVHRSPAGLGVTDLAEQAARQALADSGVGPGELDLIVLGLTDIAEYLYWDAAASLQHRLGAHGAEAVLVTQACTTAMAGLDLIAGRFATHPDYQTALIVCANRTCETYWNRMDTQSMIYSDGAAAAIARRGHPRLRWRASQAITDGRYADFYRLETGGTVHPFGTGPQPSEPPRAADAWDILDYFHYEEEPFKQFIAQIGERATAVAQRACARIGAQLTDLDRLILPHDNRHAFESLAAGFGLPASATDAELGLRTGHLGAADQLYALSVDAATGRLEPGRLVALVGLGRGMHWACTILEA
jgi:3-oxoacyl-[acyl-carrier-protein] synthase III